MRPQGLIQRMVQELSPISPLPYAPSTSRLPSNIDSLKDCPLTSLNLQLCFRLEGMTFGYCEPSYPPRTITLCKVLRPHQGLAQRMVQELSPISPLPYAPSTSPLQGNIDSLKDCPLTSLNLFICNKLEGMTFGYCEPSYPPRTITLCKVLRLQGLIQRRVQELSPISPLPCAPSTSRLPGNIDSLKDCPLTSLNLENCFRLKGMTFGYCEPSYPPRTITLCKELRLQGLVQRTFPRTFFISPHAFPPSPLPQATSWCSRAWNSPA